MGMQSEVAVEQTVKLFVGKIKERLAASSGETVELRAVGRFALTLFEFSTPAWAKEFEELFKE